MTCFYDPSAKPSQVLKLEDHTVLIDRYATLKLGKSKPDGGASLREQLSIASMPIGCCGLDMHTVAFALLSAWTPLRSNGTNLASLQTMTGHV